MHLKTDKVDFKKKPPRKKKICIFLQSPHQVDMKNVVECEKEFFAYFNALKTYSGRAKILLKLILLKSNNSKHINIPLSSPIFF